MNSLVKFYLNRIELTDTRWAVAVVTVFEW